MCYCCVRQQRPQRATRPDTRLPYTTLFRAKGVKKAVANVEGPLARVVTGLDAQEQAVVDQAMIDADGTANKSKLGANAILAVSLATAKAAAEENFLPLFQHPRGISSVPLPVPMLNVIHGGARRSDGSWEGEKGGRTGR